MGVVKDTYSCRISTSHSVLRNVEDVNSVIHLLHTSHSVGFVIQKASLDTGCSEDGAKQERVARRAS